MTRREELAAQFMAALESNPNADYFPEDMAKRAFLLADAFLAACEPEQKPEQKPEREPDAVWTLSETSDERGIIAWINGDYPHTEVRKMLAGRDRVKLAVRVVEDSE